MSDEVVIRVEKLGKKYRIRHQQQGGARYKALRDVLADKTKGVARRLWSAVGPPISAFKDVSASQHVSVSSTEEVAGFVNLPVRVGQSILSA